jgi:hypothetical protein
MEIHTNEDELKQMQLLLQEEGYKVGIQSSRPKELLVWKKLTLRDLNISNRGGYVHRLLIGVASVWLVGENFTYS